MLLISQTTSSHVPSHTRLGACGGCAACAMGVCDMAPLLIFAYKCLVSPYAGESRPMHVCHVVCKSHIGLVALITLGSREGVHIPGHPPPPHPNTWKHTYSPVPEAWALKCRNNFSSSCFKNPLVLLDGAKASVKIPKNIKDC